MRVRRGYVDGPWGQVHYARSGEGGPWIGLFHESPLSSEVWVPVLERLAPYARAVAFDTPGYGASDPPARPGLEIEDYGAVLAAAVAGLGIEQPVLAGAHTGASLAIEVAHRLDQRVSGVVLSGVPLFDEDERASFVAGWTPPVPVDVEGSQFAWAVERYQRIWPDLTPELLQIAVVQALRVAARYDWGYQAAFRYDPADPLARLEVPVLLLCAEHDMLADKDAVALRIRPDAARQVLPGLPGQPYLRDPDGYADALLAFVREVAP